MDNSVKKKYIVGAKQVTRALSNGSAVAVFVAMDAAPSVVSPICDRCKTASIPMTEVPTMKELGKTAGIAVPASVMAEIK